MSRDATRILWLFALAPLIVATVAWGSLAPAFPTKGAEGSGPAAPKRITAAIMGDPHTLYQRLNQNNGIPGIEALDDLLGARLARLDPNGGLQPQLAATVPTLEDGSWKVLSDGRMETTWKLNPVAHWHDGSPVTSEDVLFTSRVERDRDLPAFRDARYQLVETVEAPDPSTILVTWREPYFQANLPFGAPLPAHLLQEPYRTDKAGFTGLPYWTHEFVGAGVSSPRARAGEPSHPRRLRWVRAGTAQA